MKRNPYATVIIRSKDRLSELSAVIETCLQQKNADFEILVVDSTENVTDTEFYKQVYHNDDRIRVLRIPARGCAAAANEGARAAKGEILVFADDDDLPIGDSWLQSHLQNYQDPACLGVQGALLYQPAAPPSPLGVESWLLSFGFWKNARWYSYYPFRKPYIDFLMGGNASIRKEAYLRGKGWDEFLPYHNECSLFIRLQQKMKPTEYLLYDPTPEMLIRRDIPGGVGQRVEQNIVRYVDTLAKYYLWSVAPCHPLRMYGLFPLFLYYFVSSTARNAEAFIKETKDGELFAKDAYKKALYYAPVSVWKHFGKHLYRR